MKGWNNIRFYHISKRSSEVKKVAAFILTSEAEIDSDIDFLQLIPNYS